MNLEHMLKKQTDGQIECRRSRSPPAWKQSTERWKSTSIVTFSKVRHIYKAVIWPGITYESMVWHGPKETKLVPQKTINALAIIQNNCLRRIFEVYKTTLIAKLETKTHISLIDIHLNELQAKTKIKLQNSKHYERIEKIKKKIHRSLKKKRTDTENRDLFQRCRKKRDLDVLTKS